MNFCIQCTDRCQGCDNACSTAQIKPFSGFSKTSFSIHKTFVVSCHVHGFPPDHFCIFLYQSWPSQFLYQFTRTVQSNYTFRVYNVQLTVLVHISCDSSVAICHDVFTRCCHCIIDRVSLIFSFLDKSLVLCQSSFINKGLLISRLNMISLWNLDARFPDVVFIFNLLFIDVLCNKLIDSFFAWFFGPY